MVVTFELNGILFTSNQKMNGNKKDKRQKNKKGEIR